MTVLVTAGSTHGATREIAEEIARARDEHGVATELLDIDEVSDLCGQLRRSPNESQVKGG